MADRTAKLKFEAVTDPAIKAIGRLKREVIGLGAAALGIKGFKDMVVGVAAFNERLMRMKFSADLTNQQLVTMKDNLFRVSFATGESVDNLQSMSEAALKVSKNSAWVNANLKTMGQVSMVVGSSEGVGEFLSTIGTKAKLSGDALKDFAFRLISLSQQKGIKISAKDFIPMATNILNSLSLAMPGASSAQLQDAVMKAMFLNNPQSVVRAQRKLFAMLGKDKKSQQLVALGFKEGSSVGVFELIDAVMKKFKGNKTLATGFIAANFGPAALELSKLITEYDAYAEAQKKADPTKIAKQAKEAGDDWEGALTRMKTAGKLFADIHLAGPIEKLGKAISNGALWTDLEKLKIWMKAIGDMALWVGGAIAAWKIFKFVEGVVGKGGKGGGGILGGMALGTEANPMWVRMAGMGPLGGGPGTSAINGAKVLGAAAAEWIGGLGAGGIAAIALPVAGMVIAGYFANKAITEARKAEEAYNARSTDNLIDPATGKVYRPHAQTDAEKYNLFSDTPSNSPVFTIGPGGISIVANFDSSGKNTKTEVTTDKSKFVQGGK